MSKFETEYKHVREGRPAFREIKRGLIAVWGGEAIQFLNGLITNDIEALKEGEVMNAAFPNAKGRLLAVVRVKRRGKNFLFETEDATHKTVYEILFRFTMAGDFNVEDMSSNHRFLSLWNVGEFEKEGLEVFGRDCFVPVEDFKAFAADLGALGIGPETYEVIRIEEGIPLYGIDMDDTTVVPETNIENLVHYQKGCYIGQEVIARIHFLGKPAKLLKGLEFHGQVERASDELTSTDGKSAGKLTSVAFSPQLGNTIALGYVRNAFADEGTALTAGDFATTVKELPFI